MPHVSLADWVEGDRLEFLGPKLVGRPSVKKGATAELLMLGSRLGPDERIIWVEWDYARRGNAISKTTSRLFRNTSAEERG